MGVSPADNRCYFALLDKRCPTADLSNIGRTTGLFDRSAVKHALDSFIALFISAYNLDLQFFSADFGGEKFHGGFD